MNGSWYLPHTPVPSLPWLTLRADSFSHLPKLSPVGFPGGIVVMAAHSNILARKIPWTGESGGIQSVGLQRFEQDWVTECTSSLLHLSEKDLQNYEVKGACCSDIPKLSQLVCCLGIMAWKYLCIEPSTHFSNYSKTSDFGLSEFLREAIGLSS